MANTTAQLNSTIRQANTNLNSDKVITVQERGAAFIWNGNVWMGMTNSLQ